jgi:hypothetical protein
VGRTTSAGRRPRPGPPRYGRHDRTVTILECRPPWRPEYGPDRTRFPIARLRYTTSRNRWSLYRRDRNLKFHEYDIAEPRPDIQDLLDEIDRDPTSIFWG